jgi:hypothetical protein
VVGWFVFTLSYLVIMGRQGRSSKKVVPDTVSKAEECYTILSSDEEIGKKEDILCLPSPSQRRGPGNERTEPIIITPPDRTTHLIDVNEEKTTILTRNNNNKKKIILNGKNKKDDTSGDSDATEVYVHCYYFFETFL